MSLAAQTLHGRRAATPFSGGTRWMIGSLLGGSVGAALFVLGLVLDPRQAFLSYLTAYAFAISIALGALVFTMAVHTMNATWPVAVRRLSEATAASLPLLALLFIPVALGAGSLYPWMHPERVSDAHVRRIVEHKLVYLNLPFFVARSAFYLLSWTAIAWGLRSWSIRQDRDPALPAEQRGRILSGAALPLLGLTSTFASIDWLMSLSPDWYSTMYGLYFFAGGFIASLALLTVLAVRTAKCGVLALNESHYYALGRCLLAFVIFWAYIAFFQLLLMWIGDKPSEVSYYILRIQGGYRWTSGALIFAHFFIPFIALLSYRLKRRGGFLTCISVWLLLVHYLDVHWLIIPHGRSPLVVFHWLDPAALLAVGGLCVAFSIWRARGHALAAVGDVRFERALTYESI